MVYSKKFPGGLRLVVKKIDGLLSVSMGVLVGTGSCFESAEENGISHFIEHMMFKGTEKRTAFEISDAMDRIGAQVNAFTSKDITCYYAKSTSDHAEEAFPCSPISCSVPSSPKRRWTGKRGSCSRRSP